MEEWTGTEIYQRLPNLRSYDTIPETWISSAPNNQPHSIIDNQYFTLLDYSRDLSTQSFRTKDYR